MKDLEAMLEPRSIAVVGVSPKGGRGTKTVNNLLKAGYRGSIYPVNPKYDQVLGIPCYPSVSATPGPVESVVIAVPSEGVMEILEDSRKKGASAAIIFASGFSESAGDGENLQRSLRAFARENRIAVCGPNCLGVISPHSNSAVTSTTLPEDGLAAGKVGVVAQSGAVIIGLLHNEKGIEFSHLISSGNEAVVSTSDYFEYMVEDEKTGILVGFTETFKEPEKFRVVAEKALRLGKPIIILKVGRTMLGKQCTVAHTGSLAGSYEVEKALFKKIGVTAVCDLNEMITNILAFSTTRVSQGMGVGIVTMSGGELGMAMDIAQEEGLIFPELTEETKEKLRMELPDFASVKNPLDGTGKMGEKTNYRDFIDVFAGDANLDAVIVLHDIPDEREIQYIAEVARKIQKPLFLVGNIHGKISAYARKVLGDLNVPCLEGTRESFKAIKNYLYFHELRRAALQEQARTDDRNKENRTAERIFSGGPGVLNEVLGKELLTSYGIKTPRGGLCTNSREAKDLAEKVGYPVVMKICSADVAHKTAAGGVALGLKTAEEVEAAYENIMVRVKFAMPEARLEGVLVEEEVRRGFEAILGVTEDPQFGHVLLCGYGGINVELFRQFAMKVFPIDRRQAQEIVRELAGYDKLFGPEAKGPLDEDALIETILNISQIVDKYGEKIKEIDINPLIIYPKGKGTVALDALFVLK